MTKLMKGTKVRVKTTNGGEAVGVLGETYVPTYALVLDKVYGSYGVHSFAIMADRLKKVEAVA